MVELNDQQGAMEKRSDEGFKEQYMATENLRGVSKAGRIIFIVASVWTEARMGDKECIIYIRRQEAAIGETIAFGKKTDQKRELCTGHIVVNFSLVTLTSVSWQRAP